MKKRTEHKPDPKLQRLGSLRIVLCVIALILCGTTAFSALNLRPKIETTVDETTEITTAAMTTEATVETTVAATTEATVETTAAATTETIAETTTENVFKDDDRGTSDGGSAGNLNESDWPSGQDSRSDIPGPRGKPGGTIISPEGSEPTSTVPPEATEKDGEPKSFDIPSAPTQASDIPVPPAETTTDPETSEESGTTEGSETSVETETFEEPETPEEPETSGWALPALIASVVLLTADLIGVGICSGAIRRRKKELRQARLIRITGGGTVPGGDDNIRTQSLPARPASDGITVGTLQNIGGRPYQEDSSGVAKLSDGVLAVVADGMGGLSNGDKVSQKIVYTMLGFSSTLRQGQMDGVLPQMVKGTTDVVNRMLGSDGLYKSGSTLMAVLVRGSRFHWIAVGDSHIYLFRDGQLIQLNQEHNRGQDLLRRAIAGELTFDEVRADPKKSGLTSFIGMGELKYVDKSLLSIPLQAGDRIVLMTDGVFNALSDAEIASVLSRNPDVKTAAKMMEQGVLAKAAPHQDNFTAVILGL